MSERIVCWHFAAGTLRDGSPLPRKGETRTIEGEPECCVRGFHGSRRALDALNYAPGPMVARVALHGVVVSQADKDSGQSRTNLTDYADVTRVLHEFAVWCAADALDREEAAGRAVDPRSREALRVKLAWLDGKATDDELRAALDAARAAARDAARAAASAAALDAASAAALDAAWAAARAAARDAALAAAWDAAWAAARDAALAAAWDAAWAAARDAQTAELERRLLALWPEGGAE